MEEGACELCDSRWGPTKASVSVAKGHKRDLLSVERPPKSGMPIADGYEEEFISMSGAYRGIGNRDGLGNRLPRGHPKRYESWGRRAPASRAVDNSGMSNGTSHMNIASSLHGRRRRSVGGEGFRDTCMNMACTSYVGMYAHMYRSDNQYAIRGMLGSSQF